MSLARYLSKLAALLNSSGKITPAAMANGGAEFYSNNLLINPSFEIWQRGTSVSNWGSFGYTADNVQIGYDGSPASGRTVSRQTFAAGQTDVTEGDPRYYLQYEFPNVGTPTNYLRFPVEGVRTLAGRQATFSFWARVPSGTMTIGVAIAQEFGTGGSPSSGVYPAQTNYTVTTTWQKFVYTTTVGSIAGKTIGTNNNDMIWPAIWCPTNAAGTIQLANLKLEAGGVATPFQKRPVQVDLALCQRYLPATSDSSIGGTYTGQAYGTTQALIPVTFPVTARTAPTGITTTGSFSCLTSTGGANAATLTFNRAGVQSCSVTASTTGLTGGNASILLVDNGRILFTGCEL